MSEIPKENLFFFVFPNAAYLRDKVSKVVQNERNTKGKLVFLCISECSLPKRARYFINFVKEVSVFDIFFVLLQTLYVYKVKNGIETFKR